MKLYGTIEKTETQEDGTIIVSGYASSEDVDSQGEIVTASAMKAALPAYMEFANIREMHQAKAAGTALEADVQDDGRTWVKAHIVDSEAVKKIQQKVYKGFSIGGSVTGRDEADRTIITGITLSEISLVDRPANPQAVFSMGKVGARNSAADLETIQSMHDGAVKLGANCNGNCGTSDYVENKQSLHKLSSENEHLRKRIEELEARPQPAKGSLLAIAKEEDIAELKKNETPKTPLEAIKMAQQKPMIRF